MAASSAALKAATVLISGFGAPERTASPTAERVTSTVAPSPILPALTSSSISGRGNSAMSKTAPSAMSFFSTEVSRYSPSTLVPLARSNSGTISVKNVRIAPPLRILMVFEDMRPL